jgi:hypothetical protein
MSYPSSPIGKTLLLIVVVVHAAGCATPGHFVVPSVTVEGVYDDNLFFASEDEQSDYLTRVSPELELGYEADTLSWIARYRFDAEAYASETELNSSRVREFADVRVSYLPTSRLTLSAVADYTKTDTPLDLTIIPGGTIPGLLVGRAEAERMSVRSEASYRLTEPTTGSLAFTQTDEELVDVGQSDASVLETWFDQRLSEVNTLSYGYMYRQYRFDQFGIGGPAGPALTRGATQDSNTPWIGLSHQFNARTHGTVRAGPRLVGGSVDPYVLLSLQHRYTQGQVLLDYQRDETTLLGEPTKLELEALYATISRRFGTRLEVQLTPGYARLHQANASVDIHSLGLGAVYKINEAVFLTASYEFNVQEVRAVPGGLSEVSRNVIQVGARFTYPRREPREPR